MQDPSVNKCYKRTPVSLYFHNVDPQANVAPGIPEAAICVQVIAAQYILQFAIVIALCCALHRSASRVIHRSECFYKFNYFHNYVLEYRMFFEQTKRWGDRTSVARCLTAHRTPVRY